MSPPGVSLHATLRQGIRSAFSLLLLPALAISQSAKIQQPTTKPEVKTGVSPAFNPNLPIVERHVQGILRPPRTVTTPDFKLNEETKSTKSVTAELFLWVGRDGVPSHIRLVHGPGHGLDERVLEQASAFRFKPATLDGIPVTYDLYVDVFIDKF